MDKELVKEWLRYSNMDLDLAKTALSVMHPAPLEIICYHCQQAAEKFLKSVIVAFGEEVEKTHDLNKLANFLKKIKSVPSDIEDYSENLTQYATKTRYPDSVFIDEDITKRAIAQAEQVKIWAEKIIAEKSDEQEEVNNDQ